MTKVFVLPTQNSNNKLLSELKEAAKQSPLLLVFPKPKSVDYQPPEPPPLAA